MARRFHIHFLELGLVGILLAYASSNAFVGLIGSTISLLYSLFLISIYLLARSLAVRITHWLPSIIFGGFAGLLIGESIAQKLFGLHLNRFVIETLLQDNSFRFLGVSPSVAIGGVLALIAVLAVISKMTENRLLWKTDFIVAARKILLVGILLLGSSQATFAVAHYFGASTIMPVQRHMPFWAAVPRNYSETLLEPIFGPRHENPFALSEIEGPQTVSTRPTGQRHYQEGLNLNQPLENTPNILLVVADSVRAQDIAANPALAPTLMSDARTNVRSLGHLSVSNCTHFSFYSMMTGRLPNGFGYARSHRSLVGLLPDLVAAGYQVSTSEAASLDWYDLADIIMPREVSRTIYDSDDATQNDANATSSTIEAIKSWEVSRDTPKFHLTYYHGTHYPYADSITALAETNYERYLVSIGLFDRQLARLFEALDAADQWQNTLVIVTSDHGEGFQENGIVGHAGALTDYQTHVPLLVLGGSELMQKQASKLNSHLDIRPYINSILQPSSLGFEASQTQFLARCDYDYPDEFIVETAGASRYRFAYDDGYLHPLGADPNDPKVRDAALILLERLRRDAP